jgi:uncharacterized membrane protein
MTMTHWRTILQAAFVALIVLNSFIYFLLETEIGFLTATFVVVIKLLPLVLFYPALVKPNYKASLFFCLLLMLYFIFAVLTAFEGQTRGMLATGEAVILVILFSASFALGKMHK